MLPTDYGTAIFLPSIQESIFGEGETLFALSWQSLLVMSFGLVGSAGAGKCSTSLCISSEASKKLLHCGSAVPD